MEFWDPGDGTFTFDGDAYTGNVAWTQADIDAAVRAFQYWDERLVGNAPGRTVTIRLVTNQGEFGIYDNAYSANARIVSNAHVTGNNQTMPTAEYVFAEGGANPVPAGFSGLDNVIVLAPGYGNTFGNQASGPVPQENWGIEPIVMHEFGHSLGYWTEFDAAGDLVNPLTVFDVYRRDAANNPLAPGDSYLNTADGTFVGPIAMAVYGDGGAVALPIHDYTHLNINPLLMTHVQYRNIPFFVEVELAVYQDLGYTIDRSKFFGRSIYTNGAGAPEVNGAAYNLTSVYGVGLHLFATNRHITQTGNITLTGAGATGIRIDQPFDYDAAGDPVVADSNNVVTIAPGTTITASGSRSAGVLAAFGRGHTIVHRGTITTATADSQGILLDFGTNVLDAAVDINSAVIGDYLVDELDVSGTINSAGNAIEIRDTAAVRQINFMNGAAITGDIQCDALTGGGLSRPAVTFGYLADANGRVTAAIDAAFHLALNGDIRSSSAASAMNAWLVGGTTEFNGAAYFHSTNVLATATLAGSGTVESDTPVQLAGTVSPGSGGVGRLTIVGSLNSTPTATFDVEITPGGMSPVAGTHYDAVVVTETATVNGGTVQITGSPAASADYVPGTVYSFLQTSGGLTVAGLPALVENITNRTVILGYDAYSMSISFLRDQTFSDSVARTLNQKAWAASFDYTAQTLGDPDLQGILTAMNLMSTDDDVRYAMDQMDGEIHGTLPALGIRSASNFFRLLAINTRDVIPTDGPWAIGYGLGGNAEWDTNAHGMTFSEAGTMVGFLPVGGFDGNFGLVYNYGHQDTDLRGIGSHASADFHRLGAHLSLETFNNQYEYVAAMIGYNHFDVSRTVSFLGMVPSAFSGSLDLYGVPKASYDAVETGVYAEHGMMLGGPSLSVRPYVAAQYIYRAQEGFTETGGDAFNLAVRHSENDSLMVIPGIRVSSNLPPTWAYEDLTLTFDAMYQHEFLDPLAGFTGTFDVARQSSFNILGLNMGRDFYRMGPGIEMQLGSIRLFGDYQVIFNDQVVLHSGGGGLELNW